MKTKHHPTSYRLSDEARQLLVLLSDTLSQTQTGLLEMAIRAMAKSEGVRLPLHHDPRQLEMFDHPARKEG